ncbi:DUF397 domain-containing protein [Streptomyces sp. NPDC101776]|uniref:DUF397 domain-containing protein n=1 Tax=Streptomyces sp. NPDC101776 TaxID=3366146 RepID=UPI00381B0C58
MSPTAPVAGRRSPIVFPSRADFGDGRGDTCVEIATLPTRTAVRDSKLPTRATLSFPAPAFTALVEGIKAGDIDYPWSGPGSSA